MVSKVVYYRQTTTKKSKLQNEYKQKKLTHSDLSGKMFCLIGSGQLSCNLFLIFQIICFPVSQLFVTSWWSCFCHRVWPNKVYIYSPFRHLRARPSRCPKYIPFPNASPWPCLGWARASTIHGGHSPRTCRK